MSNDLLPVQHPARVAWNKGHIIGQKRPLLLRHVWSIGVRLEMAGNACDLALFNMTVHSTLRGCDLVALRVRDVLVAGRVKERTSMIESKSGKSVRFEITETTRLSLDLWIRDPKMIGLEFLWPSRIHGSPHLSTRQCARIVRDWVKSVGLEPNAYGTHSMRRTKVAQICKKTGNLRTAQLQLGHTKMDSTVRYLGVDIEDALTLSEGTDLQQTVSTGTIFAAQLTPSDACWLVIYRLAGQIGIGTGLSVAWTVLAVVRAGLLAVMRMWSTHHPAVLAHGHPDLPAVHPHLREHRPGHEQVLEIDFLLRVRPRSA